LPSGQATIVLIIFDPNALVFASFYQRLPKVAFFVNFCPIWKALLFFCKLKVGVLAPFLQNNIAVKIQKLLRLKMDQWRAVDDQNEDVEAQNLAIMGIH
jgi:hypothetical protein